MPRDHIPEWAGARSYTDPMQALRGENAKLREHLTEARRVLRLVDKQARRECPVCFSPGWTHKEGCALAAVLAQEGQ